jgi:hypothetical protein
MIARAAAPVAAPAARVALAPPGAPPASPRVPFSEVLRAHAAPEPARAEAPPGARLAAELERARARLDAALADARAGRVFSAQELLALQCDAYRYQARVEVASKIVESAAHTVKQAVNTQV